MADEYDLTSKMGVYLDRHLVFPMLEFLNEKDIYDQRELNIGKLEILNNTNMVDFALEVHKSSYPDEETPRHFEQKRSEVVRQMKAINEKMQPILQMMSEEEVKKQIDSTREGKQLFEYLERHHNFTLDHLNTIFENAQFQYKCGNYSVAGEFLYLHRALVQPDDVRAIPSLWGKLACGILMQEWDAAFEDLNRLREIIDSNPSRNQLEVLQQRTWLIHWSLFIFFNHPKGRDAIVDLFLYQAPYLNTIQTMCPWVLRYLATAVITNKRRRQVLKEVVRVIQQESYTYRDPITEFIECLYVNFDFDKAQEKLGECETVLSNDFFLIACADEFMENARLFIFETFCRIHQRISIDKLASKLNMSADEAERWIVNLIRKSPFKLDAKIDSQRGHVTMESHSVSLYDQVIEKTKTLALRTQMLATNVERRLNKEKDKADVVPHWAEGPRP